MQSRLPILCVLFLLISIICTAEAEVWTVFSVDPSWVTGPSEIALSFEDGILTLVNERMGTPGGSSHQSWGLHFSGTWATMGKIDQAGNLLPDPFATFVCNGYGGYIQWAPDTPIGYQTSLLLGHSFIEDGATTYDDLYKNTLTGKTTSGTLVLRRYTYYCQEYSYTRVEHTFTATAVPEPSSMTVLGFAVSSFIAASFRKNRYQ